MKIFLGGTCNESTWRQELISKIKCDYFNPVVDDWNKESIIEEERQKIICDYCIFVITPKMTGVYSIAEMVDRSIKHPKNTLCCFLREDDKNSFDRGQIRSLKSVGLLLRNNGVEYIFWDLMDLSKKINRIERILN